MTGRKRKERTICLDLEGMSCHMFGPIQKDNTIGDSFGEIYLSPDELQSLQYKDIDCLTMQDAADKMDISKTVFAGIYTQARQKTSDALLFSKKIIIRCQKRGINIS